MVKSGKTSARRPYQTARRRKRFSQAGVRSTCADRGTAGGAAKLGCEAGGWAGRGTLGRAAIAHYAAFDVSNKDTTIHMLDEHGRLAWKAKRPSEPEALASALRRRALKLNPFEADCA